MHRSKLRSLVVVSVALAAPLTAGGCLGDGDSRDSTPVPQPTAAQLEASGLARLPVAPDGRRVDLVAPPFSHPTKVTNPLFPIGELHSAVLNGRIDGKPFHTETTLLPYTRAIEWPAGRQVETLVSQYVAFLDGRIQEVALDYYAQADDGSVWYFGEDVVDYGEDGQIAFTTDSWLAGQDGPPAMIMPGDPKVGDAFRTENIPGLVFEEVTVKTTDKSVAGPAGPIRNAMVGVELHDDGKASEKIFAPGYGEFLTRDSDGVEAMAVAVPTDALEGPPPAELGRLSKGADDAFDAARRRDWRGVEAGSSAVWDGYPARGRIPPRLEPPLRKAVESLSAAVRARDRGRVETAAIDVARAALDVELCYRPPAEIDRARFELWARRLIVDAEANDLRRVNGDIASLGWTRDRLTAGLDPVDLTRMNRLLTIREDAVDEDLAAASVDAASLRRLAARLKLAAPTP